MPQPWESTKLHSEDPIPQYKLSQVCIDKFSLEECEKGIMLGGITLTLNWKAKQDADGKLRDFLVKFNPKEGLVDSRLYFPVSKTFKEEYIRK